MYAVRHKKDGEVVTERMEDLLLENASSDYDQNWPTLEDLQATIQNLSGTLACLVAVLYEEGSLSKMAMAELIGVEPKDLVAIGMHYQLAREDKV